MMNAHKRTDTRGFTLIELMVAVAIVAILATIALPSYRNYMVRSSRAAAQAELMDLASLQEKIFLNSNAYTGNVTAGYTGNATGGLGKTSGTTKDGYYTITASVGTGSTTYTLTAAPIAGGRQDGDGSLSITESGKRTWGTGSW
jgi:type IV pilus assembly protein PilE